MKKNALIKLIFECMNEEQTPDIANLGGGAESDAEEISIRSDVLKEIESVIKTFKSGEGITKKEIKYVAEEEQLDARKLHLSDVLFERVKNLFFNHNKMKHVTFLGVNSPMVKDEIINKLDSNPPALEVVVVDAKGSANWPASSGEDMTDDEIDAIGKEYPDETDTTEDEEDETVMENLKNALRKVIVEQIEEIKIEQESSIEKSMEDILMEVMKHFKTSKMIKTDRGNFIVDGCGTHQFDIRPMYEGSFDVVYFKNKSDREKKFNMDIKTLREYVKAKLTKENTYVLNAYNKNAENQRDQSKKVLDLPNNNKTTIKTVCDTKNENKDFNQKSVVNEEDLPDKPMTVVKKVVKQIDHDIKGTKVKYEYPSKSENKIGKKVKAPHTEKLNGKRLTT